MVAVVLDHGTVDVAQQLQCQKAAVVVVVMPITIEYQTTLGSQRQHVETADIRSSRQTYAHNTGDSTTQARKSLERTVRCDFNWSILAVAW